MTRTHPTDDELADLLRDSFAAHEELADPDRAVAIAATEAARPGRGRVLVAAAAAFALVAGGTAYAVSRGSGPSAPVAGPRTPTSTPTGDHGPSLRTNAENHALAVAMAGRVAASLPAYPGAREATVGEVPPLKVLNVVSSPERYTVTRSRFWTVAGTPRTVAGWYASHPPAGFVSDGGPTGVGGESRPDGGWIDDVFLDQTPPRRYAPAGASILVQTTRLSDGSVGIRATVDAVWRPARPAASYVSDVRAVTVRTTVTTYGTQTPRVRHRTVRISSPDAVGALVTAYNALPGWPPFFHSCPMQQLQRTYRIVFHTASGDVSVTGPMSCYDVLTVRRDGRRVGPYLDLGSDLLAHLPQ